MYGIAAKKKNVKIYVCLLGLIIFLNVLAWISPKFCDWYVAHIFPLWVNTYGRFTGLFPFSVGEIMLVLAAVVLAAMIVFTLLMPVCNGVRRLSAAGRRQAASGSRERIRKSYFVFCRGFAWAVLCIGLVMTLNCTILYHVSPLSDTFFDKKADAALTEEEKLEQVLKVYNIVAEKCNMLSGQMKRDDEGNILYEGSVNSAGESADMEDKAIEVMQQLGEVYPRLSGYYPRPKGMFFSDLMCQQYMCGYYFPFSMEANYNTVMYIMNYPATMCHELAHLHGYIYEDEASFIAFLACIKSEDSFFEYAGYLSVLNYLDNDLHRAGVQYPDAYRQAVEKYGQTDRLKQVDKDNQFVAAEEWERIEEEAVLATDIVDHASDIFTDTTLKLNGVSDGMMSYSRVVELLLLYYDV